MTVQAFYDGCEKLRTAGLAVPDPAHINPVLAEGGSDLAIQPPNLLYGVSVVSSSDLTTPVPATQASSPAELSEEGDVTLTRPTCFVIQPFDKGRYDRRYKETFAPAFEAADLQPYRVDKDDEVEVPIASIEEGIRSAVVCLADISTDNPNVWYELGFAFASQTPVVMICGPERVGKKYPFDIQHRSISPYRSDSLGDFTELADGITKKLKAALRRAANARQSAPAQQDHIGMLVLTPPELLVLVNLAGRIGSPTGTETFGAYETYVKRESQQSL